MNDVTECIHQYRIINNNQNLDNNQIHLIGLNRVLEIVNNSKLDRY